jgi:hypothetical protein
MAEFLPWLFVIVALVAVLGGMVSLWFSLSLALSDETPSDARAQVTSEARGTLLAEKEALLQEIQDVSFEHDADKLSDIDYEELNAKLRAQARHVLHELDAGTEAFRDQAEALIAERLQEQK